MKRIADKELPRRQQDALRRAIRWEWATIAYTIATIAVIALVVGNSQAMRTAWIEDMVSLLPQISFLVSLLFIRTAPSRALPFGLHRVMGVGHLVSGVALLVIGGNLAVESLAGLVAGEHPTIGTVVVLGHTIWLGWLMVGVMTIIVVGPLIYGPAKKRLAPLLHNKVLHADADMASADWQTNAASVVGVLGIGIGLWWLDGAAALFISVGILWDGVKNTRSAVLDLLDQRARTFDDAHPEPVTDQILATARRERWIVDAGVRMRDLGQVFHVELFVVPRHGRVPRATVLRDLELRLRDVDWKIQELTLVPVAELPAAVTA